MKVKRQRKFFGAPVELKDRSSSDGRAFVDCTSTSAEEKNFQLFRDEMEQGVQVCIHIWEKYNN